MKISIKKSILLAFLALLVLMVACQKPQTQKVEQKAAPSDSITGFGSSLNSTDNVEKDLSTDQLSGVDSGLDDVQNI